MVVQGLYRLSQFANLAYVQWPSVGESNADELTRLANSSSRLPTQVGNTIFGSDEWTVPSVASDNQTGFAANVFANDDDIVLAIRGTEFDSSLFPPNIGDQTFLDLLGADIQEIGFIGLAISQCVSLFNYVQCLQSASSDAHVLQLSLHSESRLGGAEPPTDQPSIRIHHQPSSLNPFGADEYFWLEVERNGTGLGVISGGEQLTVTGHSLGGHLAALAIRLFPDVFNEAVTFNAAGFDPLTSDALTEQFIALLAGYLDTPPADSFAELSNRIIRVESESSTPGDDISVVSSLVTGSPVGISTFVPTENNSHSMDQIMDALSVLNLLKELSPLSSISDITTFYHAASIQSGATEEQLVRALSNLFIGQDPALDIVEAGIVSHGDFERRSAIHERILEIEAAVNGQQFALMSLAGYSSADLVDLAAGSVAIRYAIQELNSFAVVGNDAIYDAHNDIGQLNYESFTDDYWQNRADLLVLKAVAGQLDESFLMYAGSSTTYVDEPSTFQLAHGSSDDGDPNSSQIIFGDNEAQSVDVIEGGSQVDRLFGGFGSDMLIGHEGSDLLDGGFGDDTLFGSDHLDSLMDDGTRDYLVGGDGEDRYHVGDGDEIVDSDRMVSGISHLGVEISGTYTNISEGVYQNAGGNVELIRDGNAALFVIERMEGVTGFTITDFWEAGRFFQDGDFGVTLVEDEQPIDFSFPGVIVGTAHPDRYGEFTFEFPPIAGTMGDDIVAGLEGGDLIQVYEGRDVVDGGAGPDYISSVELLPGSMESGDLLFGGDGEDVLVGSRVDDELFGGSDLDFLQGRTGSDILHGEGEDDRLNGGAGSDRLFGGEGNDVLKGDEIGYPLKNPHWSGDEDTGGPGFDIIHESDIYRPLNETGGDRDYLFGGNGRDTLLGQYGDDELFGGAGHDWLIGGPGDDYIEGGDGDDGLIGDDDNSKSMTNGNDVLFGGSGHDHLTGEGGSDLLLGGEGDDRLSGDHGEDQLFGNDGNDQLFGSEGQDILWGEQGSDILDGGEGNDVMHGGGGDDQYIFGREHGRDIIVDLEFELERGVDSVSIESELQPWDIVLEQSGSDLCISVIGAEDSLTIKSWFLHEDRVVDQIIFVSGPIWNAGAIKDVLAGRGTSVEDIYFGDPTDELFDGAGGDDFLLGGEGNDTLIGGNGDDILVGSSGNDQLVGGTGDDEIEGGDGDDILDTGPASDHRDVASGGEGNDTYVFELSYTGVHVIHEVDQDGGDVDVITFGSGISMDDLRFGRPSYQGYVNDVLLVDVVQVEASGIANLAIPGGIEVEGSQVEQFAFSDGNVIGFDEVIARLNQASDGHDYLSGTTGIDVIFGLAGHDKLFGFGESSRLFGGDGNDQMTSDAAQNELSGGQGNDALTILPHFDFYGNPVDQVSIVHGDAGDDVLKLSESLFPSTAILSGGVGHDQLSSSAGVRTVFTGHAGNDRLVLNTNGTASLILFNAGDGGDSVVFSDEHVVDVQLESGNPPFALTLSIGGEGISGIGLRRDNQNLIIEVGESDQIALLGWFALDRSSGGGAAALQVITQGTRDYDPISFDVFNNSRVQVFDLDQLIAESALMEQSAPLGERWPIQAASNAALILASDNSAVGGQLSYEFGLFGTSVSMDVAAQFGSLQSNGFPTIQQPIEVVSTAPSVHVLLADQSALEDASFGMTIPLNTFKSPFDSFDLTVRVTITGGNALPDWLHFDVASQSLTGIPQNEDVGALDIEVIATNLFGEVALDTFTLSIVNANDVPIVVVDVPDVAVEEGEEFVVTLPIDTIVDPDIGDELSIMACVDGGMPLPEWLDFDPIGMTFTGFAPLGAHGVYEIEVIAIDLESEHVEENFTLTINRASRPNESPSIEGGAGSDHISGTVGNDNIIGGGGNDLIRGHRGDDTLHGGQGNDRLNGGAGNDLISGESGNDELVGGAGDDRLQGGSGKDIVRGNDGQDVLAGGEDKDKLFGGPDSDVLSGGAGRDKLNGGRGNDVYLFGTDNGKDKVMDIAGVDTLRFDDTIAKEDVMFLRHGNHLIVDVSDGTTSITISGWFAGRTRHIERFEFSDGSILLDSQVQSLVYSMAAFDADSPLIQIALSTQSSANAWNTLSALTGLDAFGWTFGRQFNGEPSGDRHAVNM